MEPNVSVLHGGKMSSQSRSGVTRRARGGDWAAIALAGVCSPDARPTLSRFPLPDLRDARD
jgi:hypothetical protein